MPLLHRGGILTFAYIHHISLLKTLLITFFKIGCVYKNILYFCGIIIWFNLFSMNTLSNETIKNDLQKRLCDKLNPQFVHYGGCNGTYHVFHASGRGFVYVCAVFNDGCCSVYNPLSNSLIKTIQI